MSNRASISSFERPWQEADHRGPRAVFRTIRRRRGGGLCEKILTVIDDIAWQELRLMLRQQT